MQHKPEDRVLPYNSQRMLDALNFIFYYYYKCIVSKQFQSSVSIIDGISAPYHYVAIYRFTTKTAKSRIGSRISICEPRQKIVLYRFETIQPTMSQDQSSSDLWIIRVGPPMWIKMPGHCVSQPFGAQMSQLNDSIGPGSTDISEASRKPSST